MDPNAYYKYSDLGTIDNPRPREEPSSPSEADGKEAAFESALAQDDMAARDNANVVYELASFENDLGGSVLVAGYGNAQKSVVRAANDLNITPLFTTGTDDKFHAFSFGGTSNTVALGKKFDQRLFTNEFSILNAAESSKAKVILWTLPEPPSRLLEEECLRKGILLLVPLKGDKSHTLWERALNPKIAEAVESGALALNPVKWRKCSKCGFTDDNRKVVKNGYRCPTCDALVRLTSDERMSLMFDAGSVEEWDQYLDETNPMEYPDYDKIIEKNRASTGIDEAVRTGKAAIQGSELAFGIMDPSFMMGSMGSVVGEKLTRMIEKATELRLPIVIFCASGGARMQEGLASLMQMAKVSAAIERHNKSGLLYISVLTDPTTGGVTASFATLGDIILAEPGAIVGFAGRRVIQDTIKRALPDNFQTAEFALEHGLIDAIVDRDQMRSELGHLLCLHDKSCKAPDTSIMSAREAIAASVDAAFDELKVSLSAADGSESVGASKDVARDAVTVSTANATVPSASETGEDELGEGDQPSADKGSQPSLGKILNGLSELAGSLGQAVTEQTNKASLWWTLRNKGVADAPYIKPATSTPAEDSNLAWNSVQLARNAHRPTSEFYIETIFDDFVELHGDRAFSDDGAIIGGIGRINDIAVTVIAQEKGSDLKKKIARNFGCPRPEGYRKSMRLMEQAQKFDRPIICLVDTQGAFCGEEAEERGMGHAIAESLAEMSVLTVPVITVILGEGGSGGALAMAVANKVAMLENAVYSVLSPEGFASILWKDGSRAAEAASVMKMRADEVLDMGIIEDVIPEGRGPAHENPDQAAAAVWLYITTSLEELMQMTPKELQQQRYERFRNL